MLPRPGPQAFSHGVSVELSLLISQPEHNEGTSQRSNGESGLPWLRSESVSLAVDVGRGDVACDDPRTLVLGSPQPSGTFTLRRPLWPQSASPRAASEPGVGGYPGSVLGGMPPAGWTPHPTWRACDGGNEGGDMPNGSKSGAVWVDRGPWPGPELLLVGFLCISRGWLFMQLGCAHSQGVPARTYLYLCIGAKVWLGAAASPSWRRGDLVLQPRSWVVPTRPAPLCRLCAIRWGKYAFPPPGLSPLLEVQVIAPLLRPAQVSTLPSFPRVTSLPLGTRLTLLAS